MENSTFVKFEKIDDEIMCGKYGSRDAMTIVSTVLETHAKLACVSFLDLGLGYLPVNCA